MPDNSAAVAATPGGVPVFEFMVTRVPEKVPAPSAARGYIRDDVVLQVGGRSIRADVDLQSDASPSNVGRLVYTKVFCSPHLQTVQAFLDEFRPALLELLQPSKLPCSDDSTAVSQFRRWLEPLHGRQHSTAQAATSPWLSIADLEHRAWIRANGHFYLLPDRLERIDGAPLIHRLVEALPMLQAAAVPADPEPAELVAELVAEIEQVFDRQPLHRVVFADGAYTDSFRDAKRALFDALYLLYVLRRWTSIDLGPVMDGLRGLHALEALALDQVYALVRSGKFDKASRTTLQARRDLLSVLRGWDGHAKLPGLPLIAGVADLAAYLAATPVVHPIFARLFWYAKKPFNELKPLGVGDLKVVKQWLIAYLPGEICDIHNVMAGETKDRIHRRLEKTEETFSFTSAQEEESTRDSQSTDRFELKREAEQVIKADLNINANASFQYNGQPIVATVGAGFASNRSDTQTDKIAQNFSREVVSKAVRRIQSRTSQQRSTTKIFETEETNKHRFTADNQHRSGIYRWVDKRYKAQLYNYGKRMMFEFVVPEPAAFLVESRLRAFESSLDYPQLPKAPNYQTVRLGFGWIDINEDRFDQLRMKYDLSAYSYPAKKKRVAFLSQDSGALFSEKELNREDVWYAKSFTCRLNAKDYYIDRLSIIGTITYKDTSELMGAIDKSLARLSIDGTTVWQDDYSKSDSHRTVFVREDSYEPVVGPYLLTRDDVDLILSFEDVDGYDLTISADLTLDSNALEAWQKQVYKTVLDAEQKRVDEANRELKQAYDNRLSEYRNRIAELKATTINELLQGQAEAFNRELIRTELRRQCLAMLAKEFDADATDDVITDLDSMATRPGSYLVTRLNVEETQEKTTVKWDTSEAAANYPAMKLDEARGKGRFIQFLEQAFEWQQLAYLFYPYFWSIPPRWVQLMARSDDADSNFTRFLQAGAARVLVAVTPAYEQAVLHFLATGEPWEGGPTPVIGDPLYLPLYEELRKQQDDLYGGHPEGEPWEFTMPTSLVYLHHSSTPLPDLAAEMQTQKGPGS
jgi:hypothetical protein